MGSGATPHSPAGRQGERLWLLDASAVRGIVERVFGRREVLGACQRRDLGEIIRVLGAHGVTQGRIAELPGSARGG